jgi:hypothetical protein
MFHNLCQVISKNVSPPKSFTEVLHPNARCNYWPQFFHGRILGPRTGLDPNGLVIFPGPPTSRRARAVKNGLADLSTTALMVKDKNKKSWLSFRFATFLSLASLCVRLAPKNVEVDRPADFCTGKCNEFLKKCVLK